MPINVYTGLMRSGKSYEVVSQVILEAVAQGRRVVTNVDGINNDLIRAHVAESRELALDQLGIVVHCTNEQVFLPNFFPYFDDEKSFHTDTFCQPGDLVCIDEAWRFWGTDCKLIKEHKSFFLEHGHFVHPESKVACDLVLMIQDMGTLHRFVRNVVAFSFRTHKKVSLGLSNTYSLNMWEGSKMTKSTVAGTWVRRYQKAIFPLYSSFKGGEQGKTVNVDKRQNILGNKKLWGQAALIVLLGAVGVYFSQNFFDSSRFKKKASSDETASKGPSVAYNTSTQSAPHSDSVSEAWRISGVMQSGDKAYVILVGSQGRIRVEHPSAFLGKGLGLVGNIEGERMTTWSGFTSSSLLPEVKK